jgi:electron-transferring-flavoprotein dehydrogenase
LKHKQADADKLWPTSAVGVKAYPAPDNKRTFDRTSSVFLANISHDEDQPVHLKLADPAIPLRETEPAYGAEPSPHYCPAGVYEVVETGASRSFRINAANCVHCKTCDIKDPARNITWVPPEGGSGPNYVGM